MKHTLRCLLSYWRAHRLQFAISLFGVALGVAVVTAMDLANVSALASFRESVKTVTGKATHQIVAAEGNFTSGVPEELFAKVATVPGVIAAAPAIEAHGIILPSAGAVLGNTPEEERRAVGEGNGLPSPRARSARVGPLPGGERENGGAAETEHVVSGTVVRILGVDPFSEEDFREGKGVDVKFGEGSLKDWMLRDDGVVLPDHLATRIGVKIGDTVTLLHSSRRHTLRLIGTYASSDKFTRGSDDLMLMDIAAAQERFGIAPGMLSSIDLILPPAETAPDKLVREEIVQRIRALLPAGIVLQRPSERAARTEALLEAFQLNLTALSLLALVVGIFLIYNTLTVAVLQRVPIIGTLRCLGVSASDVRRAVMFEALLLGMAGSLLGLLAGRALAGIFLERVGGVVSDLYAYITAFSVLDDRAALLKGLALGLIASLAGAWFPAREAGSVSPVSVLRRSRAEHKAQRSWKVLALAGIACFITAVLLALAPGASPVPGLAAAFALALGGALCSPGVTRLFSQRSAELMRRAFGTLGLLAARGISTNLSRTGLAVGALGMALSMTIGVALMVASFRSTLDRWMDQSLHADLYLRPAGPSLMRHRAFVPPEMLEQLRKRSEVEAIDTYRGRDIVLPAAGNSADGMLALVVATDTKVTFGRGRSRFPFYAGDPDSAFEGLQNGQVIISESLARKQNLSLGDELSIPALTSGSERTLRIAGIYYEYATDRGVISMDVKTYASIFGDARANSVSLYLKPGTDLDATREALRADIGAAGGLYIFSNRTLREEAFRVFDRTFAITSQLESLSLAVGLAGILSALLALLRERSTDFALLRALGLPLKGLSKLIVFEGLLLGVVAFLVACVLGPALSFLLINVINVRAFGWTIFFSPHMDVFVRVGVLALLMSALAGMYPAWRARRMSISAALRQE
ncbi:MAG TPA: FtsX-like permease family protein [Planctomycetota bacterium]|nr:FtsX-like permease family protein [Planctomycetota bacterium]